MPSCRAARILAWPAIRPPSSPTSAGVVQPPLLDARRDRRDLRISVGPCIFRVRDQPIDRPPLDLVGRPRPLIFTADSRAGARARIPLVRSMLHRKRKKPLAGATRPAESCTKAPAPRQQLEKPRVTGRP